MQSSVLSASSVVKALAAAVVSFLLLFYFLLLVQRRLSSASAPRFALYLRTLPILDTTTVSAKEFRRTISVVFAAP